MKTDRQCSGAIVYRRTSKDLQVLLVKNKDSSTWVIPKGGVEPDLTAVHSAAKEVWEEAGVVGRIQTPLGQYRVVKDKQIQVVSIYAMEFEANAQEWPEEGRRDREWFSFKQACKRVPDVMVPLLYDLQRFINGQEFLDSVESINDEEFVGG